MGLLGVLTVVSIMPACDKEPVDAKDTTQIDTNKVDTNGTQAYLEQMFALLVLDKKITVVLAVDSGEITSHLTTITTIFSCVKARSMTVRLKFSPTEPNTWELGPQIKIILFWT